MKDLAALKAQRQTYPKRQAQTTDNPFSNQSFLRRLAATAAESAARPVPKSTTVTGSGIGTGRLSVGGSSGRVGVAVGVSAGGVFVGVGVSVEPGGTVFVAVGVGVSVEPGGTVLVSVGVLVAGSVTVVSTAGASCA